MRAIQIREFGSADGLEEVDIPRPPVSKGQLLIEVEAIGVGGVDAVIRRGTLNSYGFQPGLIPGSEVAGRVLAVADDAHTDWVGRRVWAFTGVSGAYAEFAVADSVDDVTELPSALSSTDAVALGSAGPVAHFGLSHARFERGDSVLVRGASGSIGIMAVQLAAAAGASAVGVTASTPDRAQRLLNLGATHPLDRAGQSSAGVVPEFDVILDVVGGEGLPGFFGLLAPNGRMVSLGVVAGHPPVDFGMKLFGSFQKSLSFGTFSLNSVPTVERNRVRAEQFEAAARGDILSVVHDVLPLEMAAQAHHRMDAGEVFGRIVLTV